MNLAADWEYLEAVAKRRLQHNKTARHVADYGTYIEIIGAAGELVARRFLKLPCELHDNFDGGVDLIWNEQRVDIKATVWTRKLRFRYLQWPEQKPILADIIFLTAVNLERKEAIVVGFALPAEVRNAPINRTRDYPCHEIPVCVLHGPHELLAGAEEFAGGRQPSHAYCA
jgi:hypothetical protein